MRNILNIDIDTLFQTSAQCIIVKTVRKVYSSHNVDELLKNRSKRQKERKQFSSKLNNLTGEVLAEAHYRFYTDSENAQRNQRKKRHTDSKIIHTCNELKHTECRRASFKC